MRHEPLSNPRRQWPFVSWVLLLVGLAFLCSVPGTSVWATPNQSPLRQTIPTLTPTPLPAWAWVTQPGGDPVDYAPNGVPDFDQRQSDWYVPTQPDAWSHSGPVVLADVLWWLDSRLEPEETPPPALHDGYALLRTWGEWDDHDARNVVPLVAALAQRVDTNGTRSGGQSAGTAPSNMLSGLQGYLAETGCSPDWTAYGLSSPSFEQLLACVRRGDGVVLYLGLWEDQGGGVWVYLGGHYVALAGAEPLNRLLAICDPIDDAFEAEQVPLGRASSAHGYPHVFSEHNDAQYVSQDAYHVASLALPREGMGGALSLRNYTTPLTSLGQNLAAEFEAYRGDYGGAAIQTKLDYALVVTRQFRLHLPMIIKGMQ